MQCFENRWLGPNAFQNRWVVPIRFKTAGCDQPLRAKDSTLRVNPTKFVSQRMAGDGAILATHSSAELANWPRVAVPPQRCPLLQDRTPCRPQRHRGRVNARIKAAMNPSSVHWRLCETAVWVIGW